MGRPAYSGKVSSVDVPRIPLKDFGQDHWTVLLYLETVCVDFGGKPDRLRMRCNENRHVGLSDNGICGLMPWDPQHGTRLADGTIVPDHDDYDCVIEMVDVGWVLWNGTGIYPVFRLTNDGWKKAHELRRERADRMFARVMGTPGRNE